MPTSTTTKKILTIDDEEAIVELIVDILESNGFEAKSATKWTEAVDALNHGQPDLVLLDLKMPTIHGTSMLEFIRSEGFEMPVIVVSGFVTDSVTKELYEQGVQGVVKKPFKAKALVEEIGRVLDQAPSAPQSDIEPQQETKSEAAMDALYSSAPSSPPEPEKPTTEASVDALYGTPSEQPKEEPTNGSSAPSNDILQALQKASEDTPQASPSEPAAPKPDSPAADLLDALKKREAKEAEKTAETPAAAQATPPPEATPKPVAPTPPQDAIPEAPSPLKPPTKVPPKMDDPIPAGTGSKQSGHVNELGAREPEDPFKQRSRRQPPPMRTKTTNRKNMMFMGGITVVCIVIAGFLAFMQYLASEAPEFVEKIKSETNNQIRSQVNKQVQKAQQQQVIQQLQNKGAGK